MNMRSKKAMFNVLLAVIVIVIIGLLLIVILYQMEKKSKGIKDDQKCLLSVFAKDQASKINQKLKSDAFNVKYECPRDTVRIEFDDVDKYGKIDDNLLKAKLAQEMRSCWSNVGAGKLDPFKTSTTVNENFCMVCSNIIFDSSLVKEAKKENYQLIGFQYWIAANKLPGMKTSLYEYVIGSRPTPELLSTLKQSATSDKSAFNLDQKYVVVWRVEKFEPGWWEKVAVIAGAAVLGVVTMGVGTAIVAGAAVGLAVTTQTEEATMAQEIIIIPEERLSEQRAVTEADVKQMVTKMASGPVGIGMKEPVLDFCSELIN